MVLSKEQIKQFRSIGHALKPVVTVAQNGLSETVLAELDRALTDHELIKVKITIDDRNARKDIIKNIIDQSAAAFIQEIGKVALIFRKSDKPGLKTSNIRDC